MRLYDNPQWIADIDKTIEVIPELDKLANSSVMITGASGLICSSVVDVLFRYNDTHKDKIQILAAGRSLEKMKERFHEMVNRTDFHFVSYDAAKTDNLINLHADYIIHGASNASPDKIIREPVETMFSNFLGMKFLLEYAKENAAKRILYISSSEVYGEKNGSEPYKENQYGYIDLLQSRNSYSVGKRASETLCVAYAEEYDVESVVARPGHIYGPTASIYDNRVSSAWVYAAVNGENIVMKSDGSQIRSYCYCLDCASAILTVLIKGKKCHAYNISNPTSVITIKEMAEILAKTADVELVMCSPTEDEQNRFNPMSNSSLESTSLRELGWRGCFDAKTGFKHTVKILKDVVK